MVIAPWAGKGESNRTNLILQEAVDDHEMRQVIVRSADLQEFAVRTNSSVKFDKGIGLVGKDHSPDRRTIYRNTIPGPVRRRPGNPRNRGYGHPKTGNEHRTKFRLFMATSRFPGRSQRICSGAVKLTLRKG
jgi:hypothetical protein